MAQLTQERLKKLLHYDPETGVFTRKVRMANCAAGTIAGNVNGAGYIRISVEDQSYRAHRLAWLYMTGSWPTQFLDHINMDKGDNRFCNLREATKSQNQMNTTLQSNNKTGCKGVTLNGNGKYMAMVWKDRKAHYVGQFTTIEDAARARQAAADKLHGEYARAC